jgi:hydrogenase expression/formation protein HypD
MEALRIAAEETGRRVIFPGIGFETTTPGTAATVIEAEKAGIRNFFVLGSHKLMPPAMDLLIREGANVNGFICPGHVAAIAGSSAFDFIPDRYGIGCVVSGFEPTDILHSIYMLIVQANQRRPHTEIQYKRAVTAGGNLIAKKLMADVFEEEDIYWRGFGVISSGGLRLRKRFTDMDAGLLVNEKFPEDVNEGRCRCGDILRGLMTPSQCPLFGAVCNPENPAGACMVSPEGACNAYFRYGNVE